MINPKGGVSLPALIKNGFYNTSPLASFYSYFLFFKENITKKLSFGGCCCQGVTNLHSSPTPLQKNDYDFSIEEAPTGKNGYIGERGKPFSDNCHHF